MVGFALGVAVLALVLHWPWMARRAMSQRMDVLSNRLNILDERLDTLSARINILQNVAQRNHERQTSTENLLVETIEQLAKISTKR